MKVWTRQVSPHKTPSWQARLDPVDAGRRLRNYLNVMTLEAQTIARACGHNDLHNLEPEDLCALTMEAAAMARVPLGRHRMVAGKARLWLLILKTKQGAGPACALCIATSNDRDNHE